MGFKCPFCNKDFGIERELFKSHLSSHEEPVPALDGLTYINSTDVMKKILNESGGKYEKKE